MVAFVCETVDLVINSASQQFCYVCTHTHIYLYLTRCFAHQALAVDARRVHRKPPCVAACVWGKGSKGVYVCGKDMAPHPQHITYKAYITKGVNKRLSGSPLSAQQACVLIHSPSGWGSGRWRRLRGREDVLNCLPVLFRRCPVYKDVGHLLLNPFTLNMPSPS